MTQFAIRDQLVEYGFEGRPRRIAILSVLVQGTSPLLVEILHLVHAIRALRTETKLILTQTAHHIKMCGGGHEGCTVLLEELNKLRKGMKDNMEAIARAYQSGLSIFDPTST